jgi:hypothetical protein
MLLVHFPSLLRLRPSRYGRDHQASDEISPPHGFPPLWRRVITFCAIGSQRNYARGRYGSKAVRLRPSKCFPVCPSKRTQGVYDEYTPYLNADAIFLPGSIVLATSTSLRAAMSESGERAGLDHFTDEMTCKTLPSFGPATPAASNVVPLAKR